MATREALALTEDQRALRDTVRGVLADQLPPEALRGGLNADPGYSPKLHARLARELGLAGLTVPEKFGGLGLGPVEACLVHTELGRVLYPGPLLPGGVAAGVLLGSGDRAVAERWLPLLAEGSVTATIAAADQAGRWSSGPGSVRAHLTPHGWRLYGSCWYVIAARLAGVVVVSARAGSVPAMFLVEAGAPGFRPSAQPGLDLTRRISVTAFDATPAVLLCQGDHAKAALDQAEREFLLATAAEAVGGIEWCFDAAVAYPVAREQFGRPGVSIQEVAHACVEMLTAFQTSEAAVRNAAGAAAEGAPDVPATALLAALQAGRAYREVTETAIRLFTLEHHAYLYYRRAWSAERLCGGPQAHRAALANLAPRPAAQPGPGPLSRAWLGR
jgi:alkylation response protein AidB-like acyl-CoA dehydrogenase